MSAKKSSGALIAENRKARHSYDFLEFREAGLVLTGPEVKSLRAHHVSFQDSYVEFQNGEAYLLNVHIAPYANAGYVEQNPDRPRKLLLHHQEIRVLSAAVEQKGFTVVPVRLYFNRGRIKVELALARGRKLHDHREELKRRAEVMDTRRELARTAD